jgi:hypothetical protein
VVGDFNMRIHSTPDPFDYDNPCPASIPLLADPRHTQEKDDDSKSKAFWDLVAAFKFDSDFGKRKRRCWSKVLPNE